jgi:hypothetical protein
MDSRESHLHTLLSFTRSIPDIVRDLSAYGWDAPSPLVVLDPIHISSVLNRFMAGELSSAQVEEWANFIEGREDIGYSPSSAVGLVLHELANPLLTCPLARQSAATLVATLS